MPQATTKTPSLVENHLTEFLKILLEKNLIDRDDLIALREKYHSAEEVFEALESFNRIDNTTLSEIFARVFGLPYIVFDTIDESVFEIIDKDLARRFGFIPFAKNEKSKVLQIALTSPTRIASLNEEALRALESKIGYKIEVFVTPRSSSERALGKIGRKITAVENEVERAVKEPVKVKLSKIDIPLDVYKKLPLEICRKIKGVVFNISGDTCEIALLNPTDQKTILALELIENKSGLDFRAYRAEAEEIDKALGVYENKLGDENPRKEAAQQVKENRGGEDEAKKSPLERHLEANSALSAKDSTISIGRGMEAGTQTDDEQKAQQKLVDAQINKMEDPDLVKFLGKENITSTDLKQFANENRIPHLVAGIVLMASKSRASDVHIEPFEKAVRVRFRIDGELSDVIVLSSEMNASIVARVKILSKLKIDEQRVPQDGRFDAIIGQDAIDARVSTLPTVFGEKIVMRLLSKTKKLEKLEDLGLDGKSYDRVIEAITKPYGVVLSTGPTGSGKSTTLYSVLMQINKPEVNIVTLEDPVEYQIAGINQVQIKPQIGFGFADGLRSVLRQDPNVIMVGEIRDKDTAELTTQAALTGHLVLSTLHTNAAAGALPRLYNLGVEPFLLTSAVNVVVGQRLVRRLCPKCKYEVEAPQSMIFEVKKEFEKINLSHPIQFFKGKGCENCKDGFKGRIGIFEVLTMSETIADIVIANKPETEIFTAAVKEGMITMRQDGFIKAVKGLTSVDEVVRATSEA